ncbi:hypothetical protein MBLNU457_3952t2 [Dothideomycetes sp. NU457]
MPTRHPTHTHPLYHSSRRKPRRWPLVLRFVKGAIHLDIALPVLFHAVFAVLVVGFDQRISYGFRLPNTMVPSLSVVVGLILVFRNSTSYDRFWKGQNEMTTIEASIRNLTRSFLTCSYAHDKPDPTPGERADTEDVIRILLAFAYAVKTHLRQEWGKTVPSLLQEDGGTLARLVSGEPSIKAPTPTQEHFDDLLPKGTKSFEDHGLGFPMQISLGIEAYIKRGYDRGWFHAPQASQLSVQLNNAVQAFSTMETIRTTPIPVAYLIHIRQVLALYGCTLPFAMVSEMGWWTVLAVTLITFALYGIEDGWHCRGSQGRSDGYA